MNAILLGIVGPWQIALVVIKIPQLMRGVGSGIKEFKDGMSEGEQQADKKTETIDKK